VTSAPEVWAGPECSFLRAGDWACDQLALTGHAERFEDIDLLAELGVKAVRYPVLWGRSRNRSDATDWAWAEQRLQRLHDLGIRPIVGLLHHGFGPEGSDPLDAGWPAAFGRYASEVARRFPTVRDFLPINEPVTTARFAGLYGWWAPHGRDLGTFGRLLLAQAEAYRAAAQAIRSIRPDARLFINDDLGDSVGSGGCDARARRHSERRWLAFDLVTGRVDASHPWWSVACGWGPGRRLLDALRLEPEAPDVLGIDYYVTSDRYLDERLSSFPPEYHGADEDGPYVDVELARVAGTEISSFERCTRAAWARYGLPVALTEVHLAGEAEDQVAWWLEATEGARRCALRGIPVVGVTAWSTFGAMDWSSILRHPCGSYASGCFDASGGGPPKLTLLGKAVRATDIGRPVASSLGWWRRPERALFDPRAGLAAA
jgi:dTDP-4-dehydrorhamnose reductase